MLNASGGAASGGLVSSSALLLLVLGVAVLLLSHKGITGWFGARHSEVREHLYGPQELYQPATADQQEPEDISDMPGPGGGEPDDGFDYSIFSTGPGGE